MIGVPVSGKDVPTFPSFAALPTASSFGVGVAQVGAQLHVSDGVSFDAQIDGFKSLRYIQFPSAESVKTGTFTRTTGIYSFTVTAHGYATGDCLIIDFKDETPAGAVATSGIFWIVSTGTDTFTALSEVALDNSANITTRNCSVQRIPNTPAGAAPSLAVNTSPVLGGQVLYVNKAPAGTAPTVLIDDRFTVFRGYYAGPSASNIATGVTTTTFSGSKSANSTGISFLHSGDTLEIYLQSASSQFAIKIDDEYFTDHLINSGTNGQTYYYKLTFAVKKTRRIDIIGKSFNFTGVNPGVGGTIQKSSVRGPKIIVLGDSWCTEGPGSWPCYFGDSLGVDDVWQSAIGSTGILATASGAQLNYQSRIPLDVIPYNPNIVVIQGSGNDVGGGYGSDSVLAAGLTNCVNQIRLALPNCKIVFVVPIGGAWSTSISTWSSASLKSRAVLKATATSLGCIVIDINEFPYVGTLKSGTITAQTIGGVTGAVMLGGDYSMSPNECYELQNAAGQIERIEVIKSTNNSGLIMNFTTAPLKYNYAAGDTYRQIPRTILSGSGTDGTASTWVTGTTTNLSANIAVIDSSVFTVGQMVLVGSTAAGFTVANNDTSPYHIKQIVNATTITLAQNYHPYNGIGSSSAINATASTTLQLGVPGTTPFYINAKAHPTVLGSREFGVAIAKQLASLI